MKKLITILFVCFGLATYGQTTINPDTVCVNATGEIHFVTNTPTSTYQWTITGGGGATTATTDPTLGLQLQFE